MSSVRGHKRNDIKVCPAPVAIVTPSYAWQRCWAPSKAHRYRVYTLYLWQRPSNAAEAIAQRLSMIVAGATIRRLGQAAAGPRHDLDCCPDQTSPA